MKPEPFDTELIERYLRIRRRQYFHGRHDGEYFFIVKAPYARLHIHLEIPPTDPDTLNIRVTPARFHPTTHRRRLTRLARIWNRGGPAATAIVCQSSDPTRIGVAAESLGVIGRRIRFVDFATYLDHTIASSIDLFDNISSPSDLPPTQPLRLLRNAS